MPQERDSVTAKTWMKDNAKPMFLMSSSIEYGQLESLLICTTAKEMWDKLSRVHEQKSASNKIFLLQKFHEYKMAASDSVVQHISKVQNMAAQLTDIGETVTMQQLLQKFSRV
ncbi:uncharacterized protein [Temnothorax nylanderi]|uniref:uncharacterized protein n=1 Tax=Temnothorax nylanderi TaxID=102681 RepID=UPI003A89C3F2